MQIAWIEFKFISKLELFYFGAVISKTIWLKQSVSCGAGIEPLAFSCEFGNEH
jgi:hypothetical protein